MKQDLTEGNITKHIKTIAIPASIGFFFNTMFNVVDTYFGGKLGDSALAGLSASFPAFFIIIAASTGIATATTTLVANQLGKKDEAKAKEYYIQGIFMGIISAIVLTIIGLIFSKPLLELMNLPTDAMNYAMDFLNMIFLGTIFFILASILNAYLNAQGNTKIFRNLLIIAFLLNTFLDPWFMYGGFGIPKMGIQGIALATVLTQIIECIYLLYYIKTRGILSGNVRKFVLNFSIVKQIFAQAVPSSLNMMNIAIGSFIINFFIAIFGSDAIAGYGVAIRIEQIALIPTIGLNIAALSIIGQNNGAHKFDRIQETIRKAIKLGLYALLFSVVVIVLFGRDIIEQFSPSQNISDIGMNYLYVSLFIFMAYVISFVSASALQGIKYPNRALWTGVLRQIILPLIVFPIVIYKLSEGLEGVWISLLIINWIGAILSFIIAEQSIKHREKQHHHEHKVLI
ncbi:MAG: MATE family efflux transporter [Patescibacteria group bacterium]